MRSGHTADIVVITNPQSRALMQDELSNLSDSELDNELRAVRDIRK